VARQKIEVCAMMAIVPLVDMIHPMRSLFFLCGLTASLAVIPPYEIFATAANATIKQLAESLIEFPPNGIAGENGWKLTNYQSWTSGFFPGTLFQLANRE